jgi:hypothetical protein
VRLRQAEQALTAAPWYGVWAARRAVRHAREELAMAEASVPPALTGSLFE